jgi:hypothetical protein
MKLKVLKNGDEFYIGGTHKLASLYNVRYIDLVDNKTQVCWVLEYDKNLYTIYDYRMSDREFVLKHNKMWSIGGRKSLPLEVEDKLINKIKKGQIGGLFMHHDLKWYAQDLQSQKVI